MPVDIIDHQIIGDDLQAIIITLDPGEAVVAEAGAMMYMEDGVEMSSQLSMGQSTGLLGKLFEAGKRALMTGESFFVTFFTNNSPQRRDICFAAPYPGHVIPIELSQTGGTLLCQKDAFLCGARGVQLSIAFQKRIGAGFFGGEGFILEKLSSDTCSGQAFLHAGGTIIERTLKMGEVLKVDTGCVVAFEQSVDFDIQMVPGIKNKLFGGEGLFYALLRGPGRIWMQTIPFSRLADRVMDAAARHGGKEHDEGSVLGGLGRLLGGND